MKQTIESSVLHQLLDKTPKQESLPTYDADAAAAVIMAKLSNGEMAGTADAFTKLAEHNMSLVDGDGQAIRTTLARQICILESIFTYLTNKALTKSTSEHQAIMFKTAIAAQQACAKTLSLLGSMEVKYVEEA